jgi:hypothetical protein
MVPACLRPWRWYRATVASSPFRDGFVAGIRLRNIRRARRVLSNVVDRKVGQVAAKLSLLFATLILMASMGGGFLLLAPTGPRARLGSSGVRTNGPGWWSLLPGVTVGMVSWAVVYLTIGESKPAIWLVPGIGALGAAIAIARLTPAPVDATQTTVA